MGKRHRSRNKRLGRRISFRDPKKRFLIVCEGKNTEPQYLRGFAGRFRNALVEIEIANQAGLDPKSLVEIAKELKKRSEEEAKKSDDPFLEFDAGWCVCDVDDHSTLDDARQMARDNGIYLIVSNPCFELWLLLHFQDYEKPTARDKFPNLIKKHLQKYGKHVAFKDYEASYENAVKRAKKLDELAISVGEPGRNPTTDVYQLTEAIKTGVLPD